MTLIIYTAQYRYPGADGIDTTRGGIERAKEAGLPEPEGAIFAPPKWLLDGYLAWKKGTPSRQKIAPAEYEPLYLKCMRQRYANGGKPIMLDLLRRYESEHGSIVLRCFCADGEFCHTHALSGVLMSICASEGINARVGGRVYYQALTKEWNKHAELHATPTLV